MLIHGDQDTVNGSNALCHDNDPSFLRISHRNNLTLNKIQIDSLSNCEYVIYNLTLIHCLVNLTKLWCKLILILAKNQ